jgi:hypothetical protein
MNKFLIELCLWNSKPYISTISCIKKNKPPTWIIPGCLRSQDLDLNEKLNHIIFSVTLENWEIWLFLWEF